MAGTDPLLIDVPLTFDGRGMLPPGDYPLTLVGLRHSLLIIGPPGQEAWDRAWRTSLLDNFEILVYQLWSVGVGNVFVGGSFASNKDHPADLDGYFECDRAAYKTRALRRALNALDPFHAWTWRAADRRPTPDGKLKIPLWHHYRVELLPHYGQPTTGSFDKMGNDIDVPTLFRRVRFTHEPRGIVQVIR